MKETLLINNTNDFFSSYSSLKTEKSLNINSEKFFIISFSKIDLILDDGPYDLTQIDSVYHDTIQIINRLIVCYKKKEKAQNNIFIFFNKHRLKRLIQILVIDSFLNNILQHLQTSPKKLISINNKTLSKLKNLLFLIYDLSYKTNYKICVDSHYTIKIIQKLKLINKKIYFDSKSLNYEHNLYNSTLKTINKKRSSSESDLLSTNKKLFFDLKSKKQHLDKIMSIILSSCNPTLKIFIYFKKTSEKLNTKYDFNSFNWQFDLITNNFIKSDPKTNDEYVNIELIFQSIISNLSKNDFNFKKSCLKQIVNNYNQFFKDSQSIYQNNDDKKTVIQKHNFSIKYNCNNYKFHLEKILKNPTCLSKTDNISSTELYPNIEKVKKKKIQSVRVNQNSNSATNLITTVLTNQSLKNNKDFLQFFKLNKTFFSRIKKKIPFLLNISLKKKTEWKEHLKKKFLKSNK